MATKTITICDFCGALEALPVTTAGASVDLCAACLRTELEGLLAQLPTPTQSAWLASVGGQAIDSESVSA
jgi:hypothetical protein